MKSPLLSLLLVPFITQATAKTYTYPVKSIHLDKAPTPSFYQGQNPEEGGWGSLADIHAVHGNPLSDGGSVLVGKGMESESSSKVDAFAVKLDKDGDVVWKWVSTVGGNDDVANAGVEVGGFIYVVGWRKVDGVGKRSITKLISSSGVEVWTATDFGDASGSHGAYEMITYDASSSSFLLSGLSKKSSLSEMAFKSYGNVPGGTATIQRFPLSAFGDSIPTSADATWTKTLSSHFTAKTAHFTASGDVIASLFAEEEGREASAVLLEGNGATKWGPTNYGEEHGEASDIQVSPDSDSFVIIGHGNPAGHALSGRLTRVKMSTGAREWTKSFSVGGNPKLIFNECWGGITMSDGSGYVVSCGAGIEECSDLSGQDKTDCNAGAGDTRPGAYKREAGNWQSFMYKVDLDGELLWQRVDSYRCDDCPKMDSSSFDPSSSAAEWVFEGAEGSIMVVTDEVFGIGLMKLTNSSDGGGESDGGGDDNDDENEVDGGAATFLGGRSAAIGATIMASLYMAL